MMKKTIPKKSSLIDAIIKKESEKAKAVAKLEKELKRLYESLFVRAQAFLDSKGFVSKTDAINLQATTKALGELSAILSDAGYEDVIANFQDKFEDMTVSALEYFNKFGLEPSLAGIDVESLQAYAKFSELEFSKQINKDLVSPIQSALLQVNLGNGTRSELVDQVMKLSNISSTYRATVLVDDAFSTYQRAVITQKAENLQMEIFQYLGPDDKITSPQCQAMLHADLHGIPGMLYKDEITVALHPKLTRDPLTGGGHPNCRHQWSPVTEDYAVSLGFQPRQQAEAA